MNFKDPIADIPSVCGTNCRLAAFNSSQSPFTWNTRQARRSYSAVPKCREPHEFDF